MTTILHSWLATLAALLLALVIVQPASAATITFANPAGNDGDGFGEAVAALGSDRVIIGAPGDDTGATNSGIVYLFDANRNLLTTYYNPTPAMGDGFGASVAGLGSNHVIIGAPHDSVGATRAGAAYLFSASGALLTTFTNPTPAFAEEFGITVAAVGSDRVLVGAWGDNLGTISSGAAYLFSTNGALLRTFANPTPGIGDAFGRALAAIGSDLVLISAPGDDTGAGDAGSAYLLNTDGALLTTITNPTPKSGEAFGYYSVAGVGPDKVIVGTHLENTSGTYAGAAYLFDTSGILLTTFTNPTPLLRRAFGQAVASVGSEYVLISAPEPLSSPWSGSVCLFKMDGTLVTNIPDPNPFFGGLFGYTVAAIGNDRAIVGAPEAGAGGEAYLIELGNQSIAGQFRDPLFSPADGFRFTLFDATVGQAYRIQSAASLSSATWTDLTNFTYTGPIVITDPSAGSDANKFYRAVTP